MDNLQDAALAQHILAGKGGNLRNAMAQALAAKGSIQNQVVTRDAIAAKVAQLKADPDGHHAAVAEQTALATKRANFLESHRTPPAEMTPGDGAAIALARQASAGVPTAEAVARHMVLNGPPLKLAPLPDTAGMTPTQRMKAVLEWKDRGSPA